MEEQINQTRNQYRTVATRGSILYFVIADLAGIDPMYQYSLGYVKRLFNTAIEKSPQQETLAQRLKVLIEQITATMYLNVSRGLFVAHKVLFSFLIASSINRKAGKIDEVLWGMLLRGAGAFNRSGMPENPNPSLMSQVAWDLAYFMQLTAPKYEGIATHIIENGAAWEDFAAALEP